MVKMNAALTQRGDFFSSAAPAESARTECVSADMSLSVSSGQLPPQMFYWIRHIASPQGSTVFSGIAELPSLALSGHIYENQLAKTCEL